MDTRKTPKNYIFSFPIQPHPYYQQWKRVKLQQGILINENSNKELNIVYVQPGCFPIQT